MAEAVGWIEGNLFFGLFDYVNRMAELQEHSSALDRLDQVIDWEKFRPTLGKTLEGSAFLSEVSGVDLGRCGWPTALEKAKVRKNSNRPK